VLWLGVDDVDPVAEKSEGLLQRTRWFRLHQELHLVGELVDPFQPKRHGHAFPGAHRVDRQREGRLLSVNCRLFKKQGGAAAREFHLTVGEFGDLQFGGDRSGDPAEFSGGFQFFAERAERRVGHFGRGIVGRIAYWTAAGTGFLVTSGGILRNRVFHSARSQRRTPFKTARSTFGVGSNPLTIIRWSRLFAP